jgi:DNA-binding PadR family transcriptional regulator
MYAITDHGREVAREWLREMLRTTDSEYPDFIAAVSMMFALSPEEARAALELRAGKLASALAETEAALTAAPAELPRLFLLEEEYRRAMLDTELAWVRGVIEELRSGSLTWSYEWLKQIAAAFLPADDADDREDD